MATVKPKTIKLAKIRRILRPLAWKTYSWHYHPKVQKDVEKTAIKIYDIFKDGKE